MELNFYRIPISQLEQIDINEISVFYYNTTDKARSYVSALNNNENSEGYYQILVKDMPQLSPGLQQEILTHNQDILDYLQKFTQRNKTYSPFMKENWVPLIELRQAFQDNDFNLLMGIIQSELALDPQDISSYATTISDGLEKLLRRDSKISRMVCFSYCIYKMLKYEDRELLYDFLGALIFKDLGLSQNNPNNIWDKNDLYFKHPYYTLFLLKKMPIELSKRTYFFILDHHENQDGTGFSRQKVGAHYHPLCDVLKVSEHIFSGKKSTEEYKHILRGVIQGEKLTLTQATHDCLSSIASAL
jgi:hypothetical protein